MAVSLVAERLDDADGMVRYRMANFDGRFAQVVLISSDGAQVRTDDGSEISAIAGRLLVKVLRIYQERGEWPARAGHQA